MTQRHFLTLVLMLLLVTAFFGGCARMGQPDGGWYDDTPPKVIGSSPEDKETNVTSKKVTIYFDEYIKLEDATNKVIVSPPQLEMPEIKASGKKIVVELKDTLKENTTYTIDFSDAISDNNENNPMGNYTFTFSTGEQIDTMEVSGYVLEASNLEPMKGVMVGLYDDMADSAFKKKPMLRVSRTDSRGRFVIKGVAPGTYRIYALKDADGDYCFNQKSEMIAFTHATYEPSCKPDMRQDTIWRDSLHIANIKQVKFTHFYPDDIVLLAFQEIQTDRYLIKTERNEPERIGVYFSYGNGQLPVIQGLNFEADSAFVIETNEKCDSIVYWLRDTTLVNQDTLRFSMQYEMTDTLGQLVSQTDTIEALAKTPYEKRLKERMKEYEKWQKDQEKKKKREEAYDSIMPPHFLEPKYTVSSSMDPDKEVFIEMPRPLARCDTSAIHLYAQHDSLWYNANFEFRPVKGSLRKYELIAEWRPGIEYSFEIDSLAFEDIYGNPTKSYRQGLRVKTMDEYSSLLINLSGVEDSAIIVQLIDKNGKFVKEVKARGQVAEFFYVIPGTYYLSAYVDANGNGRWDTGDYNADRQAEAVYYYPKAIECKAKWDVTQSWNLTAEPRNRQKPEAITKQKADKEKKLKDRNAERARKLGIEYVKDK